MGASESSAMRGLLILLIAVGSAQLFDRIRGGLEVINERRQNQWGDPGKAGRWVGEATLFVPGHTLKAKSWLRAVRYGATEPSNGKFAAVFSGADNKFHRDSEQGPLLTDAAAAATKMFIVGFANVFSDADDKARQIRDAILALKRVKQSRSSPLLMNIVTHSAGDADTDTCFAANYITADDIRIINRIAVGPVFDGTIMGNLGQATLGRMGRLGQFFGAQAAQELAEGSRTIETLQAAQPRLEKGIYAGAERVDILTNGVASVTPRLEGDDNVAAGDGFVQSTQRRPFVDKTVVIKAFWSSALNHLQQPGFKAVLQTINEILKD